MAEDSPAPTPQENPRPAAQAGVTEGDGPLVDLALLLSPISADQPVGEDLRYSGVYDAIREARRADDPNLPQGVWVTELKRANWRQVERLCLDALATRAKDAQIAVWLLEALIHEHGYQGALAGLQVLRGLVEAFWDDMYPQITEDGDLDYRLAPFYWVNERVTTVLRLVPITNPDTGDHHRYTWHDWENADRLEILAQKNRQARAQAEREGRPTRAKILTTVTLTPAPWLGDLSALLCCCLTEVQELEAVLDTKCGREAPGLLQFRSTLQSIADLVTGFWHDKGGVSEDIQAETADANAAATDLSSSDAGGSPMAATDSTPAPQVQGAIRSRDEAYRMLSMAAEYLMKAEPHSPTPYLVKRAVSWGSMSLDELLRELIADQGDLSKLFNLLGMDRPGSGK